MEEGKYVNNCLCLLMKNKTMADGDKLHQYFFFKITFVDDLKQKQVLHIYLTSG